MTDVDEVRDGATPPLAEPQTGVSRRAMLGGAAALGAFAAFAGAAPGVARAVAPRSEPTADDAPSRPSSSAPTSSLRDRRGAGAGGSSLGFTAIGPNVEDRVTVPDGYVAQVLIPWGDPIQPGGPTFRFDGSNTAQQQAEQFGMSHDGMHFFALSRRSGVLCVNHEALDSPVALFPIAADYTQPTTVLKAQNAHGVSVCQLDLQRDGSWQLARSGWARRITANTRMQFTGPAAGHPLLQTTADPSGLNPRGTVNNSANGATPWGTYLTCEENFNRYFGTEAAGFTPTASMNRYGVGRGDFPWWLGDTRFDLAANPNEPNRFGWVVEIDPFNPRSTPKKRTALGRLKHENAAFAEADDGRAVIYTGDDERFQYLYKYVSAEPWDRKRTSPLDDGTLHVARFDGDGTGTWLPLVEGAVPGYATLAEILIDTRGAAAAVGATPMDRPEWVAVNPTVRGAAYGSFTNNTARVTTDPANPRPNNAFGHILRWQHTGGDHGATTFIWSVFALAGAGLGTGDGSTIPPADGFGSPDGLAFDPDGRLWIETDGTQPLACNNQLLAADPVTGDVRRFLVGPKGAELTGWTMTEDQRTMFVNIQHPGENATDPTNPAAQSDWPDFNGRPRSATLAIRRIDGGIIGA